MLRLVEANRSHSVVKIMAKLTLGIGLRDPMKWKDVLNTARF
jgi:hypothetical protein